ncbi:HEAT repeat-containing protein [Besnoitia besnoiti]|uniref:HEAT repeat-containing protein n=1 Tax=Besnoitia besnoiti TaxID=94643 RepID=A0A2A9MK45_BESBE|nr:HEAT repeat-containing protein [Besnoitia besnoiti]PFH36043.1 HEAT repeat-containing protein [Besnoitia besnoiti]
MAKNVFAADDLLRISLPIAVSRFGSEDIEGVGHLPEVMRPPPEQKPTKLIPIESSEEVRGAMLEFMAALLERCSDDAIWANMDGIVGILRACAMDQCAAIQTSACAHICNFCEHHYEGLLHFTEALARSLLSCLVHPHSKVRLHGLEALTAVMRCGQYKYSAAVVQMLMGWQDPNVVPIKAFYEPCSTHNYLARLVADRTPAVRTYFYETIVRWLHRFPDKADYESWLFPYLLTGIFDENKAVQKLVYWLIEKCGELYENEKEKDIRKIRQLNYQEPWTYEGRGSVPFPLGGRAAFNAGSCSNPSEPEAASAAEFIREYEAQKSTLASIRGLDGLHELLGELDHVLTKPIARPRLGSRCWVKTHFRRYVKGLLKEVTDFKEVTSESSARLLVASLAYVEESVTEWLDGLVRFCSTLYARKTSVSSKVFRIYDEALTLVGAYVDPVSYWKLAEDVFEGTVAVLKSVGDKLLEALLLKAEWLVETCGTEERAQLFGAALAVSRHGPAKHGQNVGTSAQETEIAPHALRILQTLVGGKAVSVSLEPPRAAASIRGLPQDAFLGLLHAFVSLPPSSWNTSSLQCLVRISPPDITLNAKVFGLILDRLGEFRQRTCRPDTRRQALEVAVLWISNLLGVGNVGGSGGDALQAAAARIASRVLLPVFSAAEGFQGTLGELDCLLPLVTRSDPSSPYATRKAHFLATSGIPEALAELVANETAHRCIYARALAALRLSCKAKYGSASSSDWLDDVPVTTRRQTRLQALQASCKLKQKASVMLYSAVVQVLVVPASPAAELDTLRGSFLTLLVSKIRRALVPVKELTRLSQAEEAPDKAIEESANDVETQANEEADPIAPWVAALPLQSLDRGVAFYVSNLLGLVLQSMHLLAAHDESGECSSRHEEDDNDQLKRRRELLMVLPFMCDGGGSANKSSAFSPLRVNDGCEPQEGVSRRRRCITAHISEKDVDDFVGHLIKFYVGLGSKVHREGLQDPFPAGEAYLAPGGMLSSATATAVAKAIAELEEATEEVKDTNAADAVSNLLVYLASTFPDIFQSWQTLWSARGHVMRADACEAFQKLAATRR